MRAGVLPLLLVAAAHPVPALWIGATDGDFSLLWFAVPFASLTLLATAAWQRRWDELARTLAAVSLALAVCAVPVYLLGSLHVLQAAAGVVLLTRRRP